MYPNQQPQQPPTYGYGSYGVPQQPQQPQVPQAPQQPAQAGGPAPLPPGNTPLQSVQPGTQPNVPWQNQQYGDTGKTPQQMAQEIAAQIGGSWSNQGQLNRYADPFGGSSLGTPYNTKQGMSRVRNRAAYAKALKENQANLQQMGSVYRGLDVGDSGADLRELVEQQLALNPSFRSGATWYDPGSHGAGYDYAQDMLARLLGGM
jgi:hypothetical protein